MPPGQAILKGISHFLSPSSFSCGCGPPQSVPEKEKEREGGRAPVLHADAADCGRGSGAHHNKKEEEERGREGGL